MIGNKSVLSLLMIMIFLHAMGIYVHITHI